MKLLLPDSLFLLAPSETPASGNSKDASQSDLPIQTETTASNALVDNAVQETVKPNNPASNQESIHYKVSNFGSLISWIRILGGKNNGAKRM